MDRDTQSPGERKGYLAADPTKPDYTQCFDRGYWGPGGIDLSKWKGAEIGRGAPYKNLGPVRDGQKGAVRKISTGRKARGSAASDFERKRDA